MCLTTNDPTIRVAEKNMIVYKVIGNDNCSNSTRFLYIRGKRNMEIALRAVKYNASQPYSVDSGYHSGVDGSQTGEGIANSVFIIPKGARYIKGNYNGSNVENYVSSTIIFVGKTKTGWQRFFTNMRLKKYQK